MVFAYGVWPTLCPLSVAAIEYDPIRKKLLKGLTVVGILTSVYLLGSLWQSSVYTFVVNHSIRYETHIVGVPVLIGLYLTVTILPYFISSHRSILIFGIPHFIFFLISYFLYQRTFTSVWCFFAAVLSLTLYVFLRKLHHQPILPLFENQSPLKEDVRLSA